MTKRRYILATCLLSALPGIRAHAEAPRNVRARRLAGLQREPHRARQVADAYLAGIAGTDALQAARDLDMDAVLAPMDRVAGTTALRAWVGSRIRSDFESGTVVDVGGWILSRTEVGVCLLVASEV